MQSLWRVWRGNVALVGDASGGVDAITGEGLWLAFQQAAALADAMQRGDLRHYQREHRKLARRPSWMGAMLKRLGRHDSLRIRILKMLSQNPELFAQLLAFHVGCVTRRDLVATGAAFSWRLFAS
jgi:flavin-dependent dehydrogenase